MYTSSPHARETRRQSDSRVLLGRQSMKITSKYKCAYMHVCVSECEGHRPQHHVAPPMFSTFIVLKQGLLLNLELVDSAKGAGCQASRVSLSQNPPGQACLPVLFLILNARD